jgi:hypothetical protein
MGLKTEARAGGVPPPPLVPEPEAVQIQGVLGKYEFEKFTGPLSAIQIRRVSANM